MTARIASGMSARMVTQLAMLVLAASIAVGIGAVPVVAIAGDTGPAVVPSSDTSGLALTSGEWETNNQHRQWWNENASGGARWDALLPVGSSSDWTIAKDVVDAAPTYGTVVTTSGSARPDIVWNSTAGPDDG